jgi:uncharacterized membrane protein YdbT with pleckstrin-like domain
MTATSPVTTQPPPAVRNRRVLGWLIISQVLGLASLFPWVFFAGYGVMIVAAQPGATEQTLPWVIVGLIWVYPIILLLCAIFAWIAYAARRMRPAAVLTSVPLLFALPMLVAVLVVAVAPSLGLP